MLFNFTLAPLDEITPWGGPGQESLHWFGLTDSQYWLEVGAAKLLEYSDAARRRGSSPFCDYQAARLYEDVIDLARDVLQPIPSDLVPCIAGQGRKRTRGRMSAWCDKHPDPLDDRQWSVVDAGLTWISRRQLDTAYLTPSAHVLMWSDESMVHIEWDNRLQLIDGACAWTATVGAYSMTRAGFIAECKSFHERLMHEMSRRVGQVVAGGLSPKIRVDIQALLGEHEVRRHLSPLNVDSLASPTDWAAVREAMTLVGA
jgi:hypothetical protein